MPKKGQLKASATKRSKQQRAYNSRPEQKKRRASRNAARKKMEEAGQARKGDGKDVEHRDKNARNNGKGNITMRNRSSNRADNRGTGGRKKKKPTKRS